MLDRQEKSQPKEDLNYEEEEEMTKYLESSATGPTQAEKAYAQG